MSNPVANILFFLKKKMDRSHLARAVKKQTDFKHLANIGIIDETWSFKRRQRANKSKNAKNANTGKKNPKPKIAKSTKKIQKVDSTLATTTTKVFDNADLDDVPAAPQNVLWQYHHNGWKNYDKNASDVVEAAYQAWQSNPYTDVRAIKSGEWQYEVNFNTMEQTNIQHADHTTRKIRRSTEGF